ncbi:L-fucose mutarotase [Paenibacillus phyllosphaerae]|uniref:L-fucose mutarotase n=1 Tax=Paenibacillus phyllosphaerae TaxID=274593 RepID=A0A7W5AVQ6_9BACL|nr:L-fucose mutarotase [Paenibacillus phyllosphaerae]MBB3109684.1 L-fucose mutarotase [Paenibacillus phyllosphaerae]
MLIGISPLISPELLRILAEMGHGDELLLADANFPAARLAHRLIRCPGMPIPELLDGILRLFPLDKYTAKPVTLMDVVPGDPVDTPIWQRYAEIIEERCGMRAADERLERYDFYERAKSAYAIVATGERAQYANIILKKGVIIP